MGVLYGADVGELRSLAKSFQSASTRLHEGRTAVSDGIRISAWIGPFAASFRLSWESEHSLRMLQAANLLEAAATALRQNAEEQERASAADTGYSGVSGALYDRPQNVSAVGLDSPSSAAALWWTLKGMTDNDDGYRIQTVEGLDGKTRIIVYVNGTSAGKDLTMWANGPAVLGAANNETELVVAALAKIQAKYPGADIMFVGYSQGGMVVQYMADSGISNVKQVVTFGSPVIPAVNNYGGADVTRITDGRDIVPDAGAISAAADNPILMAIARARSGLTPAVAGVEQSFQYNNPDIWHNPVFDIGRAWVIHGDPQTYGGDATAFDNDPSAAAAREGIQRFAGVVTDDSM